VNARTTEFIAKPGRSKELRDHLCKDVTLLLREQSGFIRTTVLTSDDEPRHVIAITFWSLKEHICAPWEESPLVRKILSPLVDVWPRGRTFKVDLTGTTETDEQAMSLLTATAPSSDSALNRSRLNLGFQLGPGTEMPTPATSLDS
jgi:hypothetical protein